MKLIAEIQINEAKADAKAILMSFLLKPINID